MFARREATPILILLSETEQIFQKPNAVKLGQILDSPMAPLLAQTIISLDLGELGSWFAANWQVIGAAGLMAVLDFIFANNQAVRENSLLDFVYRRLIRPRLGGSEKKTED